MNNKERISVEELLERNIKGAIVIMGMSGIAVTQVRRLVVIGDAVRVDTGITLRASSASMEWRRTAKRPYTVLAESQARAFMLIGSFALLRKDRRGMVCIRTDTNTPIRMPKGIKEIPFPNFDNL